MLLPHAVPEEVDLSTAGLARIDTALSGCIQEGAYAGAVTLAARRGRIVHAAALGLSDIAAGTPMRMDTIFALFSMTKPVTAAAMMVLYDRGLWAPEDPIARHLPEFADLKGPDGEPLDHPPTLGELMTHTAGFAYGILPNDATDEAYMVAGVWEADSLRDMTERLAKVPLAYQPGSSWRYSISMDIQGAVIERLTGQRLGAFMGETLFEPLGMADTGFSVPAEKRHRLARVYYSAGRGGLQLLTHTRFARNGEEPKLLSGGGGLYSTAEDYARFAQMLLQKGELGTAQVLSPEAVALMTRNHLSEKMMNTGYDAGRQSIRPGAGYGFNGAVYTDPDLAGVKVGRGTYQWDGAGGTWFWIDPERELLFVGLVQRMLDPTSPRMQTLTQELCDEALL